MNILDGKTVLVTGGTGSMGQTFVRRVLTGEFGRACKIVVFSRDETKQYEMRRRHPEASYRIGDVRDYADVCAALRGVDIVVSAAALKQVPSCEYFPHQAVLTNCLGTQNLIRAISDEHGSVQTVVSISTDKACKPTTVMGMTKAIQERMIIAANVGSPYTRFIGVRYGNVLVSRGSVIPLFREQIAAGGPVTVTVPEMTRFLLTLDQAVNVTMAALTRARPGEIYVPTAPAATVLNIAHALIGNRNIEITTSGARPGEKLHEIMISEEEAQHTIRRGDYLVILPQLPELCHRRSEYGTDAAEYSSQHSVLDLPGTEKLLEAA